LSTLSKLEKIEKVSTLSELSKLSDVDELKKALCSYLKSKLYHQKHNEKNAQMIRAYKLEHPELSK